ncbi:MAG: diacylglycerol kinase family lipid kinase [Prosthecobacter sp.]|uniref:diacylglycerol/lipid kinase family protein n=1 Tax=Prosthecobacter sp. TaxID=1965333 RepID=UPI0019DFE8E4|nr:diacylglycerol kinase family protein [Prosthecobacter sp.]MBE2284534.1 diacylglycerol kinase family lipid kinase [Prosthecobacter sp.]
MSAPFMPIPVILNPAARSTKAAALEEALRALSPAPELHLTKGPGDATVIAENLADAGHELVVSAGGDGTMNEVLQGLCRANARRKPGEKHTALGVLPLGTMNVFSVELKLPGKDISECWRRITTGTRSEVDLWMANDHYFVQLGGVGLDAQIVQETSWEAKKKFGPLSYVMSAVNVLLRPPPTLSVQIDGRAPLLGTVVLLGNGKHYGGPFPLFRDASNTDGKLDLIIFRGLGGMEFLQLLRGMLLDGYQACEYLDYVQAEQFTVTSDAGDAPVELDGELASHLSGPVAFRRAPFQLGVVA